MAAIYGTSPVVLRRVLSQLRRAGLIETQRGKSGGSQLARAPGDITLREVYEAVRGEQPVLPMYSQNCTGLVAPVLGEYLGKLFHEAEEALLEKLDAVTVAEMDQVVRQRIMTHASSKGIC